MNSADTPKQRAGDMFDSLTGFDNIAIAAHFGEKPTTLAKHAQPDSIDFDPYTFLRAMAFVDKRRGGMSDPDAYTAAMELPNSAVQDYFAPDSDGNEDAGKAPSA